MNKNGENEDRSPVRASSMNTKKFDGNALPIEVAHLDEEYSVQWRKHQEKMLLLQHEHELSIAQVRFEHQAAMVVVVVAMLIALGSVITASNSNNNDCRNMM